MKDTTPDMRLCPAFTLTRCYLDHVWT